MTPAGVPDLGLLANYYDRPGADARAAEAIAQGARWIPAALALDIFPPGHLVRAFFVESDPDA